MVSVDTFVSVGATIVLREILSPRRVDALSGVAW
jgi:hypothetical protein